MSNIVVETLNSKINFLQRDRDNATLNVELKRKELKKAQDTVDQIQGLIDELGAAVDRETAAHFTVTPIFVDDNSNEIPF